ncbi:NB-ARC domain-containing protein [Streptomyces sp. Tue 6075]|uniref:NB-ARC domain-containing protein n=1 Tax=Streptomyces sp. Tue 6075 TaxID=1661694 RepID=UPI00131DDCEC|nr:NB-ARC domain-containing protein [Streptomyces sp. Tue 6075]
MAERGGQAAADGFQYQYLVTLEALLDAAEGRISGVGAALIEPAVTPDQDSTDPDAIDFELVDHGNATLHAVQVKSGGSGTEMSAPDAFGVLLRMIRARPRAQSYRLITNMRLHPKAMQLNRALSTDGPHELREQLQRLLERSRWRHEPAAMSDEELGRLHRARISVDPRERYQLRDQLRERMRRLRNEHRDGLGHDSAGRLTNYLAFEIHRRASGEFHGVFTLTQFRDELLTPGHHLAYELGEFDWGIMVSAVPAPPDIPRPDLIDQIRTALTDGGGERAVSICAVLGPSGIGKTSIAAGYAHDLADAYDHIFWVNGESGASLRASFQFIHDWLRSPGIDGADTDESRLRDRVRTLLGTSARPWLMIIDNVVDRRLVQPWIPSSGRGHVIITSTNQVSWATHPARVTVQVMTADQATALIRMRLGQQGSWDARRERTAAALAERLEHWPLAMELACGYLAGCELGLSEADTYVEQIRDLALDDRCSIPHGYPETLVGAIRLALLRLRTKQELQPASDGAAYALFRAAYFASRQIPIWLLYFATLMSIDDAVRAGLRHPAVLGPSVEVPFTTHEMHRALRTESLAQRDEPLCTLHREQWSAAHREGVDDTISVNEIVQHVVRTLAESGDDVPHILSQAAFHAQGWLAAFIQANDERHLLAVLPHVQHLANHAGRLGIATDVLAVMWGNLAGAYVLLGELDDAREALESELAYLLARKEPAPLLELKTRTQLADVLRNTGEEPAVWLKHLYLARDLARQLADFRPEDVSLVVGNCLTILAGHTGHGIAAPAIQALTDDLESLQERLPGTRRTKVQREIRRIDSALSNQQMSDEEVELCCRTLLEDKSLDRLQRLQLTAFLTEALTFQHRWIDALGNLQAIHEYMVEWPLHPQLMARTVHNVGLRVGLAVASGVPECRIALMLSMGGADAPPAPGCRPLLSTLISMVAHMPAGHLSLDAGMTCMPFKMQTLRLLDAVCEQDHERVRAAHRDLTEHDSTAFTPDDEIGWRRLSDAVIASAVSMMLRGA